MVFACRRQRIVCSIYGRMELLAALQRKLREGEFCSRPGRAG